MISKLKEYFPMIREMQKVGYLFPGQRSACYSADLLLRQYKRIRGETNVRHGIGNGTSAEILVHSP